MSNKPNLQETISLIETMLEDKRRIVHWIHAGSLMDILTLLKEQEAIEPNVSSAEQRCGNCNKVIEMDGWVACPWCGKPIAWNEWWNKNGGQEVK